MTAWSTLSCATWVGPVPGCATHHLPRGSGARAVDPHAWRTLPARRSRALTRASPRGHRASWWAFPLDLPWPWASRSGRQAPDEGARAPVSARARCHQAPPGRTERCEARGGYSRSARWPPPFAPKSSRRCHASAVRRRPPGRWPEFLYETLPSRREIASLARRLEPQGIEAISVRGHRLGLRRHGRQQLVSIQCPRTPARRLPNGRCLKPEASGASAGFVDK